MPKGLKRSIGRANPDNTPAIQYARFVFSDLPITVASGVAAKAGGGASINASGPGLPKGLVVFLAKYTKIQVTNTSEDVLDTWDGSFALGTEQITKGEAAFATEDANIEFGSLGDATAGVSPFTEASSTSTDLGVVFDWTAGAPEVFLNLLVEDDKITDEVDAVLLASGSVELAFIVLDV